MSADAIFLTCQLYEQLKSCIMSLSKNATIVPQQSFHSTTSDYSTSSKTEISSKFSDALNQQFRNKFETSACSVWKFVSNLLELLLQIAELT